mmetsp:Transcript_44843/g.106414  ORF Transcript_44843/g.106414 Transcript_44843/m.106414 type:complete len:237 (-) Transcript_44843:72-782(-)
MYQPQYAPGPWITDVGPPGPGPGPGWQPAPQVELQDLTIYKVPVVNQRTLAGRPDMLERQLDMELAQGGVWDPATRHEAAQVKGSHPSRMRGANFSRREWIHDPFYGWRTQNKSAIAPVPAVQAQLRREAAARPVEVSAEGAIEKLFGALFTSGLQPLAMPGQEVATAGTVQYTSQYDDGQYDESQPYGVHPSGFVYVDAPGTASSAPSTGATLPASEPGGPQEPPPDRKKKTACW